MSSSRCDLFDNALVQMRRSAVPRAPRQAFVMAQMKKMAHYGMVNRESVRKGMDQRYALNAMVKANISVTKDESEPFRSRKKSRNRYVLCQIEFLPSVDNLVEPAHYNNFTQFSLNYILEEDVLPGNAFFEPLFGGHQSLQKREETYCAKDQTLHCGFVKGPEGYPSSGFDLDENDELYGNLPCCGFIMHFWKLRLLEEAN